MVNMNNLRNIFFQDYRFALITIINNINSFHLILISVCGIQKNIQNIF